ncbi:MAG: hypothetical protein GF329_00940 [Candidatus Lokiarchaeota archaeon]|nr:hypothetical protein [Candidatus Lokiarchaeota archaeon]
MKILIIYFTLTGRTKKVAEVIADELSDHEVDIMPIIYEKEEEFKFKKEEEKLARGDMSSLTYNEEIFNPESYDLICLGVPTWGGQPSYVFNGYIENCNIEGKEFVIFNTCRFLSGKTLTDMKKKIEMKGGKVIEGKMFKVFFKMGEKKARKFGNYLKEILA